MINAKKMDEQVVCELDNKGVACINVTLSPKVESDNSVALSDTNAFLRFICSENIKSVFRFGFEISADDYYIDDDIIDDCIGYHRAENLNSIVVRDIEKYNRKIDKFGFEELQQIMYFVLFNGFVVYTIIADSVPFDSPEEALEDILASNEDEIARAKEAQKIQVQSLKENLKQQILADPIFALQTNQKLRRSYAYELWTNLSDEYAPLKSYWTTGNGFMKSMVAEFVDLVWAEYKQNRKTK